MNKQSFAKFQFQNNRNLHFVKTKLQVSVIFILKIIIITKIKKQIIEYNRNIQSDQTYTRLQSLCIPF